MKKIFLAVLLVLAVNVAAQQKRTYVYAERDTALRLDVWSPEVPRSDKACVIALFGGGFVSGSRDNKYQVSVAQALTARGYTVVSPDYRLGLTDSVALKRYGRSIKGIENLFEWVIDIATEDCADAVSWVVTHSGLLNINPERIVLTGSSAGAIVMTQLDYYRCNPDISAIGGRLPQGWSPAAVVPYSGAVVCKGKPDYALPPAPTMFMHGTKDKIVAYGQFPKITRYAMHGADYLYKIFAKEGYPVWIMRLDGIGHEVASYLPGSVDIFCCFVEQVFGGHVTTLDATLHDAALVPTEWTDMTVIDLYKQ